MVDFGFGRNCCFFDINTIIFIAICAFFSRTFTIHSRAGKGGGYFFNSSLTLAPASQRLRNQPGDYWRELISAHSKQSDLNREPLVSKRKLLITNLRAFKYIGSSSSKTDVDVKSVQIPMDSQGVNSHHPSSICPNKVCGKPGVKMTLSLKRLSSQLACQCCRRIGFH